MFNFNYLPIIYCDDLFAIAQKLSWSVCFVRRRTGGHIYIYIYIHTSFVCGGAIVGKSVCDENINVQLLILRLDLKYNINIKHAISCLIHLCVGNNTTYAVKI